MSTQNGRRKRNVSRSPAPPKTDPMPRPHDGPIAAGVPLAPRATVAALSQSDPDTRMPALLSAADLADLLCVSIRHLERLNHRGRLPEPLRLGRSRRWRRGEIDNWIAKGCPALTPDMHGTSRRREGGAA